MDALGLPPPILDPRMHWEKMSVSALYFVLKLCVCSTGEKYELWNIEHLSYLSIVCMHVDVLALL